MIMRASDWRHPMLCSFCIIHNYTSLPLSFSSYNSFICLILLFLNLVTIRLCSESKLSPNMLAAYSAAHSWRANSYENCFVNT